MNLLSKFLCGLGLLGGIGGGITLGIGVAQGGHVQRFLTSEQKEYSYQVSQEQYDAYKTNATDCELEIKMYSGNINIVSSLDDTFSFDYKYRIKDNRIDFPSEKHPFKIDETSNFFAWIQIDFLFNYDSDLTISIPSWFEEEVKIDLVNGKISSSVTSYTKDVYFNAVNGTIELLNLASTNNIDVKTVNGDITINASNFANPASSLVYKLETVNGDASVALSSTAVYRYTYDSVNGDHNATGSSNEGMLISFKSVNGDLVITK